MKKILCLSVCFLSVQAFALDHNCIPHIEQLEREFKNCTVEYGDNATTAFAFEGKKEELLQQGFDDVLFKPIDIHALKKLCE